MSRKNRKQIFTNIDIIDAGAKGKVIGKAPDGKVIFLSNAVPGDIVDVQTFKKRKAYYEGKAIKFIKLSEKRTSPKCEHFGTCGGCKWQHMDYEQQLYYKEKEVVNNLSRIGHLKLPKVTPILGSEQHYFYRNKMEFSFSDSRWLTPDEINSNEDITDKNALGFHIPGMWDKILDIKTCYLQGHSSNDIRNSVKKFAIDNNLKFFNPRNQSGFLRTLMIRTSSIGEIMVVLQFFKDDKSQRELILRHIASDFPNINSLQYVINQKGNDTIYDQQVHCFKGRDFILEKMEGLTFKINAKSSFALLIGAPKLSGSVISPVSEILDT